MEALTVILALSEYLLQKVGKNLRFRWISIMVQVRMHLVIAAEPSAIFRLHGLSLGEN